MIRESHGERERERLTKRNMTGPSRTTIEAVPIKPLGHLSHAWQIIPSAGPAVILVIPPDGDWIDIKIHDGRVHLHAESAARRTVTPGRGSESRNYGRKNSRGSGHDDRDEKLIGFAPDTVTTVFRVSARHAARARARAFQLSRSLGEIAPIEPIDA